MPAAIDTLKLAKRLRQADFTQPQAEALAEAVAEAMVENVATRPDLAQLRTGLQQDIGELRAELKQDVADLRAELKQDIAQLRADLKQDIAAIRTELKRDIAELEIKMGALETRMLRWMGAGFAATIATMVALLQFTHR